MSLTRSPARSLRLLTNRRRPPAAILRNCHGIALVLPPSVRHRSPRQARMDPMVTEEPGGNLEVSRRKLLAAAGMGTGVLVAASFNAIGNAQAASVPGSAPDPAATPTVSGLHLQCGADASAEVTVSWHTLQPVRNPRILFGRTDGKFERKVDAKPTGYIDGKSKQVVCAYHARIGHLQAGAEYMYGAVHD